MITPYKGFTIIKGHDWNYHVYDGKRFIGTAETLRKAKELVCKITLLAEINTTWRNRPNV
jgi:hypothetical protein